MENAESLINNLTTLPRETQWFEFKHNNVDADEIGCYISALGNSATCEDRDKAYLIWGIHDETHEVIGTSFNPYTHKVGNEELENWLRRLLSANAVFEFSMEEVKGKNIVIFTIQKAIYTPITFKREAYIRSGSYKKHLRDVPALEVKLWSKLNLAKYETIRAKENLDKGTLLSTLDYPAYFDLTEMPMPADADQIIHYLIEDYLVQKQDSGLYAITNTGALLFAKKLSEFPTLSRKRLRVIQYAGVSRISTKSDLTFDRGYASSFEEMMRYIEGLLPKKELILDGIRQGVPHYPSIAIRELVANALIHQDFVPSGVGPLVEIFDNRIEITNPGVSLVKVSRIIDNPPKSRNEILAALMRRFGICEEQGSGWDKIATATEDALLPAPKMIIYDEATRVVLSDSISFDLMSTDDKVWACYLHACLRYANGEKMNNASLRTRFGLSANEKTKISRLLRTATDRGCIKPFNPDTAPRYMHYVPHWVY